MRSFVNYINNKHKSIDEEVQSSKVTESIENKRDKELQLTKLVVEALQILLRGIQQK